jgi:hypothetical protein
VQLSVNDECFLLDIQMGLKDDTGGQIYCARIVRVDVQSMFTQLSISAILDVVFCNTIYVGCFATSTSF